MGLVLGVMAGLFGLGLLIVPLIIDVYQSRKSSNAKYKKQLEASVGLIVVGMIFMLGGLILVGFSSSWGLAKSGYSGLSGGFEGSGGRKVERGAGGGEGGGNNELLTYLLLRDERARGLEGEEGLGAEGLEGEEGLGAEGLAGEAGAEEGLGSLAEEGAELAI